MSTEQAAAVLPSSTPLAGALLVPASDTAVEEVEPNDDAAAALPLAVPVDKAYLFDAGGRAFRRLVCIRRARSRSRTGRAAHGRRVRAAAAANRGCLTDATERKAS